MELKICSNCQQAKKYIFKRYVANLQGQLLCDSCYRKCLDICSLCSRHQVTYCFSDKNKPICKTCATQPSRTCKSCGKQFPAGRGLICKECSYFNTLGKKISILNLILSNYTNKVFESFIWWMKDYRGVVFTACKIQKYFIFFYQLDLLANKLCKFPTYNEIIAHFTLAYTRRYLLVMIFLEKNQIITIDMNEKGNVANMNMIDKYLASFPIGTYEHTLLNRYFMYLFEKYKQGLTTIRSIRLGLTPAIKLLKYKSNFKQEHINDFIIDGYLWIYPGQTFELTGFVNFLNTNFKYNLHPIKKITRTFARPSTTKKQLKLRFITLLQKESLTSHQQNRLLNIAIEYLHGVKIPKNVYLGEENLFKKNDSMHIRLCGYDFYIPDVLYEKIIDKLSS